MLGYIGYSCRTMTSGRGQFLKWKFLPLLTNAHVTWPEEVIKETKEREAAAKK